MLAVQDGLVTVLIVGCGQNRSVLDLRLRHGLPVAVADPPPLLLTRGLDVKQADGLAVHFELVLHIAGEGEGLRASQINAPILKLFAVKDGDRHDAAGLGLARFAGPLEHGDRAQYGNALGVLCDLTGILRPCGQGSEGSGCNHGCGCR